jgi:hypothetical protein
MNTKITILASFLWGLAVLSALAWNSYDQNQAQKKLAFQTARAFFQQVVVTRLWNAGHGGVYVAVTQETQPNKYLEDPLRDLTTSESIQLTKINPAYMTRQISEISLQSKNGIQFHITSLNPIRPDNKATQWEKEWLETFEQGVKEQGSFITENGEPSFRYMAPLTVGNNCLSCHAKQGYKEGDIRGGISITLPNFSQNINMVLVITYGLCAVFGIGLIVISGRIIETQHQRLQQTNKSLENEILERQKAFKQLQEASEEVQQLKGIVPICMHCKEIRDDDGFWNRLENYIESHSGAQFSHSICEKCLDKLYPEEDDIE